MKLYRVCTENKNYPDILDYLDQNFPDGYTVIHANGTWQGVREKSLVIELVVDNACFRFDNSDIEHFIYWLKKHNEQDEVMLQTFDVVIDLL